MTTIDTRVFPYRGYESTVGGGYDGSNDVFTLNRIPVPGTLRLTLSPEGLSPVEGIDFTRSEAILTFVTPPVSGGNLEATYLTEG